MTLDRRRFLKLSAAGAGTAAAFGGLGFNLSEVHAQAAKPALKTAQAKESTSVCAYCSVGCGLIVSVDPTTGRCINLDGDPDHPINEGSLCAKGASLRQTGENPLRIQKPLYRASGSDKWEEKSWDWMLTEIAKRVKKTRDEGFTAKNDKAQVVNRVTNIASVGSAAMDNEECWLYQSMLRSLGLVYIEHQARICHSATVAALAESYGRGVMTNHWIDLKNSDVVLAMGANPAENHPISFKWVLKAKEAGGKLIHVDPRYTRTTNHADLYVPLRSGSDIAILGGMIKYILDNKLFFEEYVKEYTNASFLVSKDFKFTDGLFSGYDAAARKYDKKSWEYQTNEDGTFKKDPTFKDPNCVINLLKKHYARYDLDKVATISGSPKDKLLEFYKIYSATGKPDKAGTIMYAMGWTQHSVGVQNIRAMAIIQMLLGNIGVAGGGVNALRGESNVQGSTDQGLLFHIWPGYLGTPAGSLTDLEAFKKARIPTTKEAKSLNWQSNYGKYIVSYLKCLYPDLDPAEAYTLMPKLDDGKGYHWLKLFDDMSKGQFKGFFAWGMNPAASGAAANKTRAALGTLDWMVNVNLFDNETGSFWKGPGMDPKSIKTEVFFLPCSMSYEKEGSISNSGRWMQWRYAGAKPMGETKPDGDIIYELFEKIKELYTKEGGAFPDPILKLNFDAAENHVFDPHKVAKRINGFFLTDKKIGDKEYKKGDPVPSFALLQDDGSTACGNWVYAGSYTDKNNAARRDKTQTPMQEKIGIYPTWTWAWPVNRRIAYNRASVNPEGKPYAPQKAVIEWKDGKWVGDVPDGPQPPMKEEKGVKPFIMRNEGVGRLFGPGLVDGPFPEFYEPLECPVGKHPFSKQLHNPVAVDFEKQKSVCDPRFPFICSTYRVTEHWQTGVMTRWTPWLVEAEPQMFVEMSEELAKLRGVQNGDKCIVESVRGKVECVAMVTKRIKPFKLMGQVVHQVGVPWHFGWVWPKNGGDSANLLVPAVGDPNTAIPESKAFMVNVKKA